MHVHSYNKSSDTGGLTECFASDEKRTVRIWDKFTEEDGIVKRVINFDTSEKSTIASRRDEFYGRGDGLLFKVRKGNRVIYRYDPTQSSGRLFAYIESPVYVEILWQDRADGLIRAKYSIGLKFECEYSILREQCLCHRVTLSSVPSSIRLGEWFGGMIETQCMSPFSWVVSCNMISEEIIYTGTPCTGPSRHSEVIDDAKRSILQAFEICMSPACPRCSSE